MVFIPPRTPQKDLSGLAIILFGLGSGVVGFAMMLLSNDTQRLLLGGACLLFIACPLFIVMGFVTAIRNRSFTKHKQGARSPRSRRGERVRRSG
jgi:hypothetical protein